MGTVTEQRGICYVGGELEAVNTEGLIRKINLKNMENELIFGYIKKKRSEMSEMAQAFLEFLRQKFI